MLSTVEYHHMSTGAMTQIMFPESHPRSPFRFARRPINGIPYHLEFTHKHDIPAGRVPSQENLLVFYLPDAADWQEAVDRMVACGFAADSVL